MRSRSPFIYSLLLLAFTASACNEARFAGTGRSRGANSNNGSNNPGGPTNGIPGGDPNDPSNNSPSGRTNAPVDVSLNPPNGVTPGSNGGSNTPGGSGTPGTGTNTPGGGTGTNGGYPNGVVPKPGSGGETIKRQFAIQCSNGMDSSIATVDIGAPRTTRIEAQIQGEFCPASTNKLSVLFLVDFSASMGKHMFNGDGKVYDGQDPLNESTGSCGRLSAAQALLAKIESIAKAGDDVQVSMIPFAGSVVNEHIVKFRSLASFKASLTKENFCRYVAQGSQYFTPGYIDPSTVSASSATNYGAAFLAAENALVSQNGQKLVYFISDGEPTAPSSDPVGSGIRAGQNLRNRTTNLTVNGLLLKTRHPDAIDILNKVTGSPDRVKLVDQASQLADKILEFKNAAIDERFGSAKIYAAPYPEQSLGLVSMKKTGEQVWTYVTQPFVLVGIPGQMIENRVTVFAKGMDGSVHSSVITVRYTQQ